MRHTNTIEQKLKFIVLDTLIGIKNNGYKGKTHLEPYPKELVDREIKRKESAIAARAMPKPLKVKSRNMCESKKWENKANGILCEDCGSGYMLYMLKEYKNILRFKCEECYVKTIGEE